MSDSTDIDVINRILKGDTEAYSEIVKKYQDRVFRYVSYRMNNYEVALDITQDIFLVVYESLASFRREAAFSTWMYSIMINYCRNYRKKEERMNQVSLNRLVGEEEYEMQLPDERQTPEQDVINRDSLRIVTEELYQMQDDYKEIIILRDIEGLSYNEIAKTLGISLANVKVRIHRGREALKNRLQKRGLLQ